MNQVRSLVQDSHGPFNPGSGLHSDQMLRELLALHEEMIAQLRLEQLEVASTSDFLAGMIEQHERAVVLLKAQLENREVAPTAVAPAVQTEKPN